MNGKERVVLVLLKNNKGFISTYFLGMFLYITTIVSLILFNLNVRLKTMVNLDLLNEQQLAEAEVIEKVKIELFEEKINRIQREKEKEELEMRKKEAMGNGEEYSEDTFEEREEAEEELYISGLYEITIDFPHHANLLIQYNPETLEVIDYEVYRDMEEVQYERQIPLTEGVLLIK